MNRSSGHGTTMGTASFMAPMKALGIGLPENAAIPVAEARSNEIARLTGRRIVDAGAPGSRAVREPGA